MESDSAKNNDVDTLMDLKCTLIEEFNALGIKDLTITDLNLLKGSYVNLEYPLPNGQSVKLLEDDKVYLGNQIERTDSERCYGIVADEQYLLVCEYGCGGADPEIILYKKRGVYSRGSASYPLPHLSR